MARDFHERFAAARDVFAEASEALDLNLATLCFDGDPRLDSTEFTQPALLTAELAMFRALEAEFGLRADYFGGHSLGEYTALCAARVIPLAVAVRLVRRRGALMQAAVPVGEGAMAAVSAPGVASLNLTEHLQGLEVDVGNRNSPDQVVISGATRDVEEASLRLLAVLAHLEPKIVRLNVSAPFHSRLMRSIEPAFREALEAAAPTFVPGRAAGVTSNLTGAFYVPELPALMDGLSQQVSRTVEWTENMRVLAAASDRLVEVGPNRPLRGFFKALGRDVTAVLSVRAAEAMSV